MSPQIAHPQSVTFDANLTKYSVRKFADFRLAELICGLSTFDNSTCQIGGGGGVAKGWGVVEPCISRRGYFVLVKIQILHA
jgi:hypothetical protein